MAINVSPVRTMNARAAGECGPRITSGAIRIVAPNCVSHQNRRRRADPKRHRERKRGEIERNLMSQRAVRSQASPSTSPTSGKRAVFNLQMNTHRPSEREHAPERPQFESAKFKETNAPAADSANRYQKSPAP